MDPSLQLVWSSPSLTHPSVSSYACLYLHYPQMTLSSLIACYIFILCAFFLVHFYPLPSLGDSYLSFKIPPKYHFLWETFFVSQTELKDPPPCPDSCLCISTPAPPMLYTKYVKWICLLTVETSLRLETIFLSFYSQQLTQSLVHGNCSVSVCRVNKWVDGWVGECMSEGMHKLPAASHSPAFPCSILPWAFFPRPWTLHHFCHPKATLLLKGRAALGSYDHFFHALVSGL